MQMNTVRLEFLRTNLRLKLNRELKELHRIRTELSDVCNRVDNKIKKEREKTSHKKEG